MLNGEGLLLNALEVWDSSLRSWSIGLTVGLERQKPK